MCLSREPRSPPVKRTHPTPYFKHASAPSKETAPAASPLRELAGRRRGILSEQEGFTPPWGTLRSPNPRQQVTGQTKRVFGGRLPLLQSGRVVGLVLLLVAGVGVEAIPGHPRGLSRCSSGPYIL